MDRVDRFGGCEGDDQSPLSEGERALMGAQGKVLMMLLTVLKGRNLVDAAEFARLLGIFSVVVAEDDKLQGDILAVWAGMMREIP